MVVGFVLIVCLLLYVCLTVILISDSGFCCLLFMRVWQI